MKNNFLFILVAVYLILVLSINISALDVNVTPYQTIQLPQLNSTIQSNQLGLHRTYLYCSWRIDGNGEEAILINGTLCPPTPQVFTFERDQTFYARIDFANISYSQVTNQWVIDNTGNVNSMQNSYKLNVPEPPASIFNTIYNSIFGAVRSMICNIFPGLGFCS